MNGRLHLYQGYRPEEFAALMRDVEAVAQALGSAR